MAPEVAAITRAQGRTSPTRNKAPIPTTQWVQLIKREAVQVTKQLSKAKPLMGTEAPRNPQKMEKQSLKWVKKDDQQKSLEAPEHSQPQIAEREDQVTESTTDGLSRQK